MDEDDHTARWHAGRALYAEIFGAARVQARLETTDPDGTRLADLLMEFAYGTVWANDVLTRRERSLITVAMLAALGRDDELRAHLRGALVNGCSDAELFETTIHVILYAGFPAGLTARRVLREVVAT